MEEYNSLYKFTKAVMANSTSFVTKSITIVTFLAFSADSYLSDFIIIHRIK